MSAAAARRYASLDAWRGLAALAVLLAHTYRSLTSLGLAVQVFFVISGYCLAAALENGVDRQQGFLSFMGRRARRILPPYLASLAFMAAVIVWLAGADKLRHPALWGLNLTLTQWLAVTFRLVVLRAPAVGPADNPVLMQPIYWSLGYEEQFYFLVAFATAFTRTVPAAVTLGAVTLGALALNARHPDLWTGTFVDYWSHFALGILVYVRTVKLAHPLLRASVDLSLVVTLLAAVARGRTELAVCLATALVLVALRRTDRAFMASPPGRLLGAFGGMSYSLYLTHFPFSFLSRPVRDAIIRAAGEAVADLAVVLASVGFAAVFAALFEKPFLAARWSSAGAPLAPRPPPPEVSV